MRFQATLEALLFANTVTAAPFGAVEVTDGACKDGVRARRSVNIPRLPGPLARFGEIQVLAVR